MRRQDIEADPVVGSRWDRGIGVLREITAGGLAGLTAGVIVAGVGSRLVMRVTSLVSPSTSIGRTTDAGFKVGTVTLAGSLEVLLFIGLGFGLLGGVLLVAVWPWVSGWGRWRPVALSGFVLALGSTEVIDPRNIDFFILGNRTLLVLLFVALFFAWGFLAVWFRDALERALPKSSRGSTAVYVIVALMGLPFTALLPAVLFDSATHTPTVVGVAVMLVAVGTLVTWIFRIWTSRSEPPRAVQWIGYGGYAATLVFGLTRAASDALDIITRFGLR